jgi:hypothetical protein
MMIIGLALAAWCVASVPLAILVGKVLQRGEARVARPYRASAPLAATPTRASSAIAIRPMTAR